ncbi:MAG: endolytic transglycosylase MltG [Ginsengibacter sp.]
MKKIILIIVLLLIIGALAGAWIFLGPATNFSSPKKALYIRTNAATKQAVVDSLKKNGIIKHTAAFAWLAGQLKYWNNIKPGKYEIKKGSSLLTIVRMLRNGRQTPVNLVITKIRTKEDLARMVGNRFECDSAQMIAFLNNPDSLQPYGADTTNALWRIIPDTYTYFWNTTPEKIYDKLYAASKKFWNDERRQKAERLGLSPQQVYTLASIVEEETNAHSEKDTIASVYLNRLNKGMPLQADPTIKFAMRDFGLKRIYQKYLFTESPYNTYRNRGLPPGPICTPSKTTIEAVLNAPPTEYLYFVANSAFNGTHVFSNSYAEHMQKARAYQQVLNQRDSARQANQQTR